MLKKIFLAILCSALSGAALAGSNAWPAEKKIRFVVPFPAGGGADIIARLIAPALSRELGQTIYIDNRSGAGGSLGTQAALKEPADGYTLIYVTNGTLATNLALYPNVGYEPLRDMRPVSRLTHLPLLLVTKHDCADLKTFLSRAKTDSPAWTFSSAGNGTTSHLAGVYLSKLTGIGFEHIPYRGGAASITDVLAARIDFTIDVAPNTLAHVKAGALKSLGISSRQRLDSAPDVAAIADTVPGYELYAWDGIAVKSGTDEFIVEKLRKAVEKILADPQMVQALAQRGAQVADNRTQRFEDFVQSEQQKWRSLVQEAQARRD